MQPRRLVTVPLVAALIGPASALVGPALAVAGRPLPVAGPRPTLAEPAPALAAAPRQTPDPNPCLGPDAMHLRCPDLVMRRPWGLYADRFTKPGHTVLRAGNSIDNIGLGPAELHGVRTRKRWMRAHQRIYRTDGSRLAVETFARLQFKFAHQNRFWWKFYDAARFELWRLDRRGERVRRVRVGPKVAYCLRDLARTRPTLRRSPRRSVYPACSTDRTRKRDTLGTSIGWSDIYPPSYPEQWIDVTGLRGCFIYIHTADPDNRIFELDEHNNAAQVVVRLPFRVGDRRGGCKGHDRGKPFEGYGPYRY
jgi:lysyl oxidase